MFFDSFENRCALCDYYEQCEYAEQVNFCEDCKDNNICTIRNVQCLAGHDIECNNSFEPKSEADWEDEYDTESQ